LKASERRKELSDKRVSIVIPAFNEEGAIARQIRDVTAAMQQSGWTYELIVVDDGSTDRTAAEAESTGARVLRQSSNGGYGTALKAGITASVYDWILITDADGTYPAASIPHLLERAPDAEMVVGARVGENVQIPWMRRPAKWFLGWYANLVAMRKIPDLNSGLRLIQKTHIRRFWTLLPAGFSFTTTITLAMLTTGSKVEYVTIDYHRRVGQSKIRATDFLRFLRLVTRIGLRLRPLRILLAFGSLAIAIATLLLLATNAEVQWDAIWVALALLCGSGAILERRAIRERKQV
jgi:glycosyltransferase involved in cell wall biosynthesis